jgi:hypothetical protein
MQRRFPSALPNSTPIDRAAESARRCVDQPPTVSREEFWLETIRREIHFREQRATGSGAGPARREGKGAGKWPTARPRLTAEDIRVHAWLAERLAVLHHERYGLWPKLRRFFFGSRLERRLLQTKRTK